MLAQRTHSIVLTLLVLLFTTPRQVMSAAGGVNPNRILKELVPEIPRLTVLPEKDLEPNPRGKYRRYTFIEGDFNRDGQDDVAISAVDNPDSQARSRNSYVLIASKNKNGAWVRVFFEKFAGVSLPFLIWDEEEKALLVGANQSDYDPGDILWDPKAKKYILVEPKHK